MLYAWFLGLLQDKAKEMGYNLILHGSLNRDCDMVAVAWTDDPRPSFELINELYFILRDCRLENKEQFLYSVLPGGRESYVISLNRQLISEDHPDYKEGVQHDQQYYLDISVVNGNRKPAR